LREPSASTIGFQHQDLVQQRRGDRGDPGQRGDDGEMSNQQLNDAIAGSSANTNGVQLLDLNANLPTVIAKLNELIQAQRR